MLKAALTLLALLAGIIFLNLVCASEDWLFYQRGFNDLPNRIVVYHEGQRTELQAGDAGYDQLAEAIRSSLAQGVARQSGIGLSDVSLKDAHDKNISVEAFFDHPVKLHAGFNTGHPTQMLFLITGRHSDLPLVFLGTNGVYRVNTPLLHTLDPIRDALKTLGYL